MSFSCLKRLVCTSLILTLVAVPLSAGNTLQDEKIARTVLTCADGALSFAGDAMLLDGKNSHAAIGCKVAGSLCNLVSNVYNPSMPKEVRAIRAISDGVRTVASFQTKKPDNIGIGVLLRLVSVGADWFAIKKEYECKYEHDETDEDTRHWAFAKLISSWSRALADGMSLNRFGKMFSYFSAAIDSYELLRVLNPEAYEEKTEREVEARERKPRCLSEVDNPKDRIAYFRKLAKKPNKILKNIECQICFQDDKRRRKDFSMCPHCTYILCKSCVGRLRACPQCRKRIGKNSIIT